MPFEFQPMQPEPRKVTMYRFRIHRKDGNVFDVEARTRSGAQGRATRLICGLHGRHANRSRKWKIARDMIDHIECIGLVGEMIIKRHNADGSITKITKKAGKKLSKMELFTLTCIGADEMVKLGIMTESERVEAIKKRGKELGI